MLTPLSEWEEKKYSKMDMRAAFEQGWDNSYRHHLGKSGDKGTTLDFDKLKNSTYLKYKPNA